MAESLDGHSIDGLSCRSSTLAAESDVLTITAADEKNEDLDFVFSWYHTLAVTEFSELQLRRLDGKDSKVFLVAVLCDQSICCIGLGITENLNLLPILGAKGTSDVSFYHPSYMPELAKGSSMLVNLRFSHRRRDLIDLLQILHCVQSSLTAIPSPAGLNDIYVWTSLMIFERTFWDWDKWAAQLQRDAIVGASVTAAKAEYDSLAARRSSIVHIPTGRFSAPPVNSQPESRSKSMDMLCSILTAEWDSAMRAVDDTLVHDSLRDNVYLSLVEAVTRSARAAAIQSATTAAHAAARSATQASAKECAYNAAWESLWDAGGTEDDIIGRGGLAYIAECVAEGIPRLEHDSDMQLLRASPCASRPGWLIGCNAGWVEGWRAGRRAAMRFTWDALGGDLPLGEWSGDLDAGWDAAWEQVSPADRLVTRPHVGREAGRSEYNVSWDDGWELGCQAGYDVGWESGRDGAKLSARRSWRSARLAAVACGFDRIWDILGDWEISVIPRKRLADNPGENLGAHKVSDQRDWNLALETVWNRVWDGGPPLVRLACEEVARRIMEKMDQIDVCGPEIIIWSLSQLHGARETSCAPIILQSHALGQLHELFPSEGRIKETAPKITQHRNALSFVSQIWVKTQSSAS